ncbi:beta-glucosidase [Sphingomonas sp. NFR04]|uniref:beta-glucosidase n=1 Tax=Sphingomonas sp. NFR04 TaxID=1566283 RepID=UPI0008E0B05F|nr:glycoside hydrolase family 3 protein [Sphingomonas sp. NFR04]SFK56103.1 beta-glucosidase [Sphingomonas sp. NFR04]
MNAARALALLLLAGTAPAASYAQSAPPAWQDSKLAPEARAAALVRAMTHAEKLKLVHGLFPPRAQPAPADMIPSAGYVPGIPRLGIPTLRESDASLGVANQVEQRKGDVATALPSGLATAATFDPELARAGGAMIGAEARAKTFNVLLAGGVNLTRDAWNGRNFEYLGEDPILAGTMAGAAIDGVQSNHIVSTIKHFILNAQETGRTVLNARIGDAALRESDLLAFEIAIKAGKPGSVMCAYNRIEGDYACESARMLTDVLRRDWGYTGWVMSDWGAVHSTVKAAMSGLDQESGQELDHAIYFAPETIDAAIQAGQITEARIDQMVTRILTGVIASGLYDHPTPTTAQPIDYAAHAQVAQRVAEAGMVLLRNQGDLLPLAKSAKKILLIGGHADVGVLSGGGSSQVRSVGGAPVEIPLTKGAAASFARVTWHASSPLQAIRAKAPQAQVTYVDGSDPAAAAAAARAADMVVLFATQWATEAQDVDSLALPDKQDALIAAVAKANPKTVVVLETGGPVLMPWLEQVPAVLQAWYPGQRGGEAIAGILFGDVNPSGHLPISFPRSADQLPRPKPVVPAGLDSNAASDAGAGDGSVLPSWDVTYSEGADVGYRWYAAKGTQPLFPFGYGLSYTRFGFSDARFTGGAAPSVTVTVRNQGVRAGAVVPQLYVAGPEGGAPRLAAWKRQWLKPGEAAQVTLTADRHALARWKNGGWVIPAGTYRLAVGQDSASATMAREVAVPGGAVRE